MSAPAAPYVQKVIVSLEKQGAGTTWHNRGENDTPFLTLPDDDVQILGAGIGGLGSYAGDPPARRGSAGRSATMAGSPRAMTASCTSTGSEGTGAS